jgi:hypothetical protein
MRGSLPFVERKSAQKFLALDVLIRKHGFFWSWQDQFCAPGQFAPGEHDAMPTDPTFQANIRAKAHNRPFIGTTWVRFPQTEDIVKL